MSGWLEGLLRQAHEEWAEANAPGNAHRGVTEPVLYLGGELWKKARWELSTKRAFAYTRPAHNPDEYQAMGVTIVVTCHLGPYSHPTWRPIR